MAKVKKTTAPPKSSKKAKVTVAKGLAQKTKVKTVTKKKK